MYGQCPSGDVTLSSQEAVDEFVSQYGDCEVINGNLLLVTGLTNDGPGGVGGTLLSNITNTSGLNKLQIIRGDLTITIEASDLRNFTSLEEVDGELSITNSNNLLVIDSFNSLRRAGSVVIANNGILESINGFNSLTSLEGNLEIGSLTKTTSVNGFSNLTQIGGRLNISQNLELETIPSFNNLITIANDLNINLSPNLRAVDGFQKLTSIGNDFNIENVTRIDGFYGLETVGRFFDIRGLRITSIPAFASLRETGGAFRIYNTSIVRFDGFYELRSTGSTNFLKDWFIVSDNKELTSVSGFSRLNFVDGNLEVENNTKLSDCSWLCAIMNNGEITGKIVIQNNIGDCINAPSVIEICDDDFDNDGIPNVIDLDDDNDGILDTIEGTPFTDTDNDGYPNTKDLDADGDGCFDVIEAGYEDPNGDGILGDLPDEVDIFGKIINEPTGYTPPDDKDSNGTLDFLEKSTLDPGENTVREYCFNEPTFDLLETLDGTPDSGGIWSPALSSGTNVFDPSKDEPGIYTYTHTNSFCGDRTATLDLRIIDDRSAGLDTELLVCETTGNVDLFTLLKGNPNAGGYWTPELTSGTSIYNPAVDTAPVYKYSIQGRFCGLMSAEITIVQSKKPYAGEDASLVLCEFAPAVNLFDLIGENVDTNGVWSNNLRDGLFDPSIHPSGTYTYTVDNGSCGVDVASVFVQVVADAPLRDVWVKVNDFSARNNNVEVFVYSNREYQYSLDGITYQDENVFNNVPGGKQTVYVRGTDGCEYYTEEIYIRTFPPFFTPNGDGNNDFWQLKDFPDENYTIYIYNRYGSLMKKMNQNQFWDGTLNGKPLNSSDYWFKVITEKGEVLQGNFSLLRN
jgi:gliding motility-associated-like protein